MTELLLVTFFLLLLYYLFFLYKIYTGLNNLGTSEGNIPGEYVSVIIPFRNEANNIHSNLASIEGQDYPSDKFEVIYVDDSSEDNSFILLKNSITKSNIRVLNNSSFSSGKKHAVAYGIKNAKGEIIVTTDSDCIYNKNWLSMLLKNFQPDVAMVAGAVRFYPVNNIFEKIQAVEFAGLITAGAGLIGAGSPIICNAANLAYRKKIFYELNGFQENIHLASGDDEFLMQKISREIRYKIKFCAEREAVVSTKPNSNLTQFFNQRKRWASKGFFYDFRITIQLLLIFLFYAGLLIQLILIPFSPLFLISLLISLFAKIVFEYLIMKKGTDLLFDSSILKNFLVTELLHIPYIIFIPLMGTFNGFRWKNRNIKP
jgi:cellulose synthase/poly-beta-1,6-N-acetylglucosamine synthase-like glycosyltransferase